MSSLRLLLALLTLLAAGAGPAMELRRRSWRGGWGSLAGLSYVLGFGLLGLVSVLLMLTGLRTSSYVPPLVAAASLAWAAMRARPPAPRPERAGLLAWSLVALPVAAAFGLAAASDDPGWDVRAFWSLKARSIERHGSFRNPDFQDAELRPHAHARYPLLVPSVHAWIHAATGRVDGRDLRLAMAIFYAASLAVVWNALRERVPERPAWLLTSVFAFTPAVFTGESGGALSAYADYPLAIFLLLAAVELRGWLEERDPRGAWGAGFALACLPQMKDEGLAMAVVLLGTSTAFAFRSGGLRRALAATAIPAAGLLLGGAWLLARRSLIPDAANLMASQGVFWSRLPEVFRLLLSQMLRWKEWGVLWPAALLLLALRPPSPRDPESLLPWTAGLLLLIYMGVWISFPAASAKEIMQHGANRLVLQVMPLAFVWAAGRIPGLLPAPAPASEIAT